MKNGPLTQQVLIGFKEDVAADAGLIFCEQPDANTAHFKRRADCLRRALQHLRERLALDDAESGQLESCGFKPLGGNGRGGRAGS